MTNENSRPVESEAYQKNGFVGPLRAVSEEEACCLAQDYWAKIHDQNKQAARQLDAHEHFLPLSRLVQAPTIIQSVKSLLGPQIVLWSARYLPLTGDLDANGQMPFRTTWHQEMDFFLALGRNMDVPGVQLWLALDLATAQNGAMQVIPGSHRDPAFSVDRVYDIPALSEMQHAHMHSRSVIGPLVAARHDPVIVFTALPGQFYLFDWKLVHQTGSYSRPSDRRLIVNARFTSATAFDQSQYRADFPAPQYL